MHQHPSSPPPSGGSGGGCATVFCSISDDKELLFSYNGGGCELEAMAYVQLKKAPLHHAWCSHTTPENTTVGFLMEDGRTYFAVIHGRGNLESLLFLRSLRDGFVKTSKTGAALRAELDALVHGLIHGADGGGGGGGGDSDGSGRGAESLTAERPARATAPAEVAVMSPRDRKKGNKDRAAGTTDDQTGDHNLDRGLKIDIAQEHGAVAMASRSRGSSSKTMRAPQQSAQVWRRHVKVVAAIDAVLCLGLLAAWLVMCRGLQCVASS